ncbi:MAG: 23S rRNA (adenine(2503)-C(2))-methyltransferase RlmN [Clostridiaceae bacterium]
MINILDLTPDELKKTLAEIGDKPFRANQILNWIYQGVFEFDEMKNLGEETKTLLKKQFVVEVPPMIRLLKSMDGTRKGLLSLSDSNIIEAVLMKYEHGYSVCISTQVGCRMGCSFCASTKEGLIRNLTAGEMIGQILALQKIAGERISNVVLMGSGEPLDNFEQVKKFLSMVSQPWGLNIGQRHITLSTCGVAPNIRKFADLDNQVTLAISLHQTDDVARRKLMPIAYQYDLKELFSALHYYQDKTKRRISFEFALMNGVNDSEADAIKLRNLLQGLKSHINLIPLNEIKDGIYHKPDGKRVEAFRQKMEELGIETTTRREKGADIDAACGQLKRSFLDQGGEPDGREVD